MRTCSPIVLAALVAAVGASHVARADGEGAQRPAAPAPADAAETPRKVDADALAQLERWDGAMHVPTRDVKKELTAKAEGKIPDVLGKGQLEATLSWTPEGGIDLDVTLPREFAERQPPQAVTMLREMLRARAKESLRPALEKPSAMATDYDVALTKKKAKDAEIRGVELLAHAKAARFERRRMWFDADGRCESETMVLRIDPATQDIIEQSLIGAEVETTYGYEKHGERSVLTRMNTLMPIGEMTVKYDYFDVPGGTPLLRAITLELPGMLQHPIEVTFHDYVVDGTAVEATKPADAPAVTPKDAPGAGDEGGKGDESK